MDIKLSNSIFMIRPPMDWHEDEYYKFSLEEINGQEDPFEKYDFNRT